MEKLQPCNIFIRMPNWLGDFIMALPVIVDVKKRFPKAKVTVMCLSSFQVLLQNHPYIDTIFSFDKPQNIWDFRRHKNIIKKIKDGSYDLGILLTNSFSSALWMFLGKVKYRLGYNLHGRRFLLNHSFVREENVHQITSYKKLLFPLAVPHSETMPKVFVTQQEIENIISILENYGYAKDKPLVVIHPGAAYGDAKCWLPERFQEVAQYLIEHLSCYVVFVGQAFAKDLIDTIMQKLGRRAINLVGKTNMRELASLLAVSTVLLTNDSGPMHLAAALDTAVVAIFGSTDSKKTGPFAKAKILYKPLECSPCFKRKCPYEKKCMQMITSEEVIEAVRQFV